MPKSPSKPSEPAMPAASDGGSSPERAHRREQDAEELDERTSGRPTLVPSIPPEAHAKRTMLEAENRLKANFSALGNRAEQGDSDRVSQVPTIQPPPSPASSSQTAATSGYSIRPPPNKSGALDFVDAHSRVSEQPAPIAFSEPVKVGPKVELDPGASLSDLYAVGNFTDAMREAEARLALDPDDEDAMRYADECRRTLTTMYTARLGPAGSLLRIVARAEEIRWMSLNHRTGFILSLIDGHSTLDDLLDICGMPRLDALTILVELQERGVLRSVPSGR